MDKAKKAEYQRRWKEKNKEKWDAYMENWRTKNKQNVKDQRQEYYQATKDIQKAHAIKWQAENPERFVLSCKAVSANKKYPDKITTKDIDFIIERDGRTCYWCKKEDLAIDDLTLEHLQPINRVEYLTIACSRCNCARYHKYGKIPTTDELKARQKIRKQEWAIKNKERLKEKKRLYHLANKEELNRKARERYYAKMEGKDI